MTGEEFLNKLYKDLNISEEVKHASKGINDKNEAVKTYLDRLERTHSNLDHLHKLNLLKSLYYKKYVIKAEDIPKYRDKEKIITSQKESLDKWLNYFLDENTKYPMWAKYWTFQGMLKIGTYNEATGTYQKRSKKTLAPFIEVNPEILSKCINLITTYIEKNELTDEELSKLVESGNFQKMYTLLINRKKLNISSKSNNNDGIWIKYSYEDIDEVEKKEKIGITPEYIKLFNSLQGYNTGWCTAGSLEIAKDQICGIDIYNGGDFYVYYTKDENNKYKIPRIAIRMSYYDDIEEIRGIADGQNLEDGLEDILIEKLKMLNLKSEQVNENIERAKDSKRLTELVKKQKNKIDFSLEELRFLYEIDRIIVGFGWDADDRLKNILKERDNTKDIVSILDKCDSTEDRIKLILKNKFNFKYIPYDYKDYFQIAIECVKENGILLSQVPSTINNYFEIAMTAVTNFPYALRYVDKTINNYNLIVNEAMKQNVSNLKHLLSDIEINKNRNSSR